MILGLGLDIVEIVRIVKIRERHGARFLEKCFLPDEVAYCFARKNTDQHLAARFAAKEAAMKALATGWADGVGFRSVEVVRSNDGPPALRLHGKARERADALGAERLHLTLSHSDANAVAVVVLEGESGKG